MSAATHVSSPDVNLTLAAIERGVCTICTWQNLVIIVWRAAGTGPAVEQLARITSQMRVTHPEKVSHIHIVKNRAGMPDSAARATLVKIMHDHAAGIANCAVVVGGIGFWASTMRSAITSMRLLAPRSFEMRLHAASTEILTWLPAAHEQRTGIPLPHAVLSALLQQAERWFDDGVDIGPSR
jgi:hypothetical protein